MEAAAFDRLVTDLRGPRLPRVWSVLVTIFGDLAQDGSAISARVLGLILSQIGVRPEAMRVALHRLRKDGWIESERRGRSRAYRLSPQGRAETAAASPWIYAKAPLASEAYLVLTDPAAGQDEGLAAAKGAWITGTVLLTPVAPEIEGAFVTRIGPDDLLPNWMRDKVCDPETLRLSRAFSARLLSVAPDLLTDRALDPMQQAVVRVLIVHAWRRIVLKAPALPDHVFPVGWAGAVCRDRVGQVLDRLPQCRPEDLEQSVEG